jgi:lysophospholipid acyltransferase (LPLAT)-like uncharacterized protein
VTEGAVQPRGRRFNTKQRVMLAVIPPLVSGLWKLLETTCRHEVRGQEHVAACVHEHECLLAAFWHESIGMAAYCHRNRGYHTLTSQSFDGELAARVVHRFGFHVVRGSSSRGGGKALHELRLVLVERGAVGIPLDGPRGPRRQAKIGIAALAAQTQTPILPQAFAAAPAWRLRSSWDRLPIPKPFGRVITLYGPPIPPPPVNAPREVLEATRLRVEEELNRLHAVLEAELGDASIDGPP